MSRIESNDLAWSEMVTAEEMRAVERTAIESGQATGWSMMTRAGEGAVGGILGVWPDLGEGAHAAILLCGPGNNGGDGFVVAAGLLRRGWAVDVFLFGESDALKGEARTAHDAYAAAGGTARAWRAEDIAAALRARAGRRLVVVEALFGTGLARDCDAVLKVWDDAWEMAGLDARSAHLVTLDMPAGISSDTGRCLGERAFEADLCVTFHLPKAGHVLGDARDWIDRLRVVPIGLGRETYTGVGTPLMTAARVTDIGKRGGHKYQEGHVVVVSGPAFAGGAARLAARGALRAGAGLVTVLARADALPEHAAQLTAIMLRETADGAALARRLREDERLNAVCIGPGLGTDAHAADLVQAAVGSGRLCLLDADALTVLSQRRPLFQQLHRGCVLTPHAGEFKRLFSEIAGRMMEDPGFTKLAATREAAAQAGCTVLFKGVTTVIAEPEGRVIVNAGLYHRNSGWLATAGTGDVLSGMIAGLLGRGQAPLQAAATAAWLHNEAACVHGPGLISEDVPEMLPEVFRRLGL